MQRISATQEAPVFHTDFSACNAYANGENAAKAVSCPTLFLLGKRDMMTPPKAAAGLGAIISHACTVQLEDCGHALMSEQPDAVLDALYSFLR
jgi:pimeloyl-ACP methyl ester carboxylesterase